jgi:hypothetical protein
VSRAQLTLCSPTEREKAKRWIDDFPTGTRVTFTESKRTSDQNARLWASLTDVATQLTWHGQKLTPDDWKILFLDALSRETRAVPSIDGNGAVDLGRSSSRLSKAEFSDLLELIAAFGAEHGVVFHDRVTEAA